jgi:hypothetical protein
METSLPSLCLCSNYNEGIQDQLAAACCSLDGRSTRPGVACNPRICTASGAAESLSSRNTWSAFWLFRYAFQSFLIEANKRADECLRTYCKILYLGGLWPEPSRKQGSPGSVLAVAEPSRPDMERNVCCCKLLGTSPRNLRMSFRWSEEPYLYEGDHLYFWFRNSSGDLSFFIAVSERDLAFGGRDDLASLRRPRTALKQAPRRSGPFFDAEQLCGCGVANLFDVGR